MSSRYLDMVRGQRRRGGFQFTAKTGLAILAVVAMTGSAAYWWGVQRTLTDNTTVAALFLLYYSFDIQYAWWSAQEVVADSGYVLPQVLVGIIGFIIIPALLWTPVTSDELVEQVRQAHLVKRYELQTQADIAILRNTLLRAQEKALIGFANLTVQEREELASVMRGLVRGIDGTMKEIANSVKSVSGATVPFSSLEDNDQIKGYLDYISEALTDTSLLPNSAANRERLTQSSSATIAQRPTQTQTQQYAEERRG